MCASISPWLLYSSLENIFLKPNELSDIMDYITDENFSRPGGILKLLIAIIFSENVNQFKTFVSVSMKMTNVSIGSSDSHMQIKLPEYMSEICSWNHLQRIAQSTERVRKKN